MSPPIAHRLVCHGCRRQVPLAETRPYRCRWGESGDNIDHVLRRTFDASSFANQTDPGALFRAAESNPFRKYRRLFYSYQIARRGGMGDDAYLEIVDRLDAAIADVVGSGFRSTPFELQEPLARRVGLGSDRLWVKDETGNVSGSHKARHLMGIMLWLEAIRALRRPRGTAPDLAIASCGNAALAAAVIARAADRPLRVFVPPDASQRILESLSALGADTHTCPRLGSDPPGDPCFFRFLEAWRSGALPFTVQAKRNGLALEGGCTLAWEIVARLLERGAKLDHLVVQVGGGALAASCVEGLRNARDLGLIERLPRVHTVQTASAYPLRRAYDRLVAHLLRTEAPGPPAPGDRFDYAKDGARAEKIRSSVSAEQLAATLRHGIHHRGDFMWPWETVPKSIAYGILDDETYDWIPVVEGMLETGGVPTVVSEERLARTHHLARERTGIPVEPTGSAGLAGLAELVEAGVIRPEETAAVLFTGVER